MGSGLVGVEGCVPWGRGGLAGVRWLSGWTGVGVGADVDWPVTEGIGDREEKVVDGEVGEECGF